MSTLKNCSQEKTPSQNNWLTDLKESHKYANQVNKVCQKCGKIFAYHNKGVSKKTGKPYENYKCNCGNIEWVNLDETPEKIAEAEYFDSIFDEASHNKQL
jgi:lysyl-tRNA synthetase class I